MAGAREPSPGSISISDLTDAPGLAAAVADRIWRAWWEPYGASLADVEGALKEVASATDFPFTLLATRHGQFLGTVTAIQTDIHQRPDLGPCLAALWVEPQARRQRIAHMLMAAAMARLSSHGFTHVYLAAKPPLRPFYEAAGWSIIESDVGDDHLGVFVRALP